MNVNNQKEVEDRIFIVNDPIKFRNEIQELMNQNAGIIREETKLQNGLKRILELREQFYSKDNILNEFKIDDDGNGKNVVLSCEVKSSLVVCENIIRSALMRQESRGAHYRSDFPVGPDYKVDVLEGAPSANYASEHKEFSGLVIPTRRRIYRCRPDGQPILDSTIVAIDFHEIKAD